MKELLRIMTTDGFVLSATRFIPKVSNGKIILVNSATGVKQHFYADFAAFLADEGFIVYTYDYRGIGSSRPEKLRGFKAFMSDWGAWDYRAMLHNVLQTHPQSRVIVIGHSVGGQFAGFTSLTTKADLLVMVGAQTPFWKNYSGLWMRIKLIVLWFMAIPFMTKIAGYFPASKLGLFENLPAGVARQWSRWARSKNYIFDELPEMENKFSSLQQPALMISMSDDDLAPQTAVKELMHYYPKVKWSHWHLRPEDLLQNRIGHFGFFRKGMKATLWKAMLEWIDKPLSAKQSKAA